MYLINCIYKTAQYVLFIQSLKLRLLRPLNKYFRQKATIFSKIYLVREHSQLRCLGSFPQ